MKRILLASLCLCLALAVPAWAGPKRITIATAGTAGALYPMGVAMAETINRHAKGFAASAEASAGSLQNLRNLAAGKVDWGISMNEAAYLAYHGLDKWRGRPVKEIRSLFGTLISWLQIFAPADSPLKTVADFKGRRIGLGAPGSGGEQAARRVLAYYGLSYQDIKPEFMSNPEMVAALKDGTLDAFIITHPLRSAALMDLTSSFKVKLIPVADPGFYRKYPYYTMRQIPAGTYPGVKQAVPTPTNRVNMYVSTRSGLSADDVYALLKAVWDHADEWRGVHPAVKRYTTLKDALVAIKVPLHPGAVRFYRERGFTIPARLLAK